MRISFFSLIGPARLSRRSPLKGSPIRASRRRTRVRASASCCEAQRPREALGEVNGNYHSLILPFVWRRSSYRRSFGRTHSAPFGPWCVHCFYGPNRHLKLGPMIRASCDTKRSTPLSSLYRFGRRNKIQWCALTRLSLRLSRSTFQRVHILLFFPRLYRCGPRIKLLVTFYDDPPAEEAAR